MLGKAELCRRWFTKRPMVLHGSRLGNYRWHKFWWGFVLFCFWWRGKGGFSAAPKKTSIGGCVSTQGQQGAGEAQLWGSRPSSRDASLSLHLRPCFRPGRHPEVGGGRKGRVKASGPGGSGWRKRSRGSATATTAAAVLGAAAASPPRRHYSFFLVRVRLEPVRGFAAATDCVAYEV